MFVVEIVLVGVMGLLFLWFGISLMFEKPDVTGFTTGLVAIALIIIFTAIIVVGAFYSGLYNYNHADDQILAELIKKIELTIT